MTGGRKLALVIDLDACVGCHACTVACKGWHALSPATTLGDRDSHGAAPEGAFLTRVHCYEIENETGPAQILSFPRVCQHCEDPPCVPVCPTGASHLRLDGVVAIDDARCLGCGLCAWACPYGARELDPVAGVMRKCTLCLDLPQDPSRPEDDSAPACVRACPTGARHVGDLGDPHSPLSRLVAERGGFALLPELGTRPAGRYLPPRPKDAAPAVPPLSPIAPGQGVRAWIDRLAGRR
ncbi:Fe-S-cluster-containing dehydrogenase component [Cereibacter ovatus]|uniref:Fe-S-cluster-containing dehydrogenase component n=1 Tax=Cereibacter ovatus TaxID=439529 RepID=A0A285D2K0_9RHOB|nr:4Fe-4S dicluster domain-containing protein [Cereibacter ovatus]SNX74047.1 Fe-S-cluster-containing dehydrogenase component [Cereibacter ovatus]